MKSVRNLLQLAATPSATQPQGGYQRPYDVDWSRGFSEGLGEVQVDGKWGFIDATANLVVPAKYDQVLPFSGGFAPVRRGALIRGSPEGGLPGLSGSWHWVDYTGREVARNQYLIVGQLSEGLAVASPNGKTRGFASPDGQLKVPAKFLFASGFSEGLAAVQVGEAPLVRWGYINTRGEFAVEPRHELAGPFDGGRAVIARGDSYGLINATGADVAVLPYARVRELRLRQGRCGVLKDGRWGFIDEAGGLVIPCQFEWVDPFHEGLAAAARDGKVGFIDRKGKFIIEPRFDLELRADGSGHLAQPHPYYFSEGVAAVRKDGKWGYISRTGEWVIQAQFDKAGPFTEGAAKVAIDNRLGYIDRTGKYIWEPTR